MFLTNRQRGGILLFHRSKQKIFTWPSISLSKKNSIIMILVFTCIIIVDSTVVKFVSYSAVEPPVWLNIAIFMIFGIIFAVGAATLLGSARKITTDEYFPVARLGVNYFHN